MALRILMLTTALGVALGLAEVAARALRLDDFHAILKLWPDQPPILRFDETRGWTGRLKTGRLNLQGFRFPRPYSREKGDELRIALLGDSLVFGLWVGPGEHLSVLLDERDGIEAYAFGLPGYGPAQELLLLEHVLDQYELDAVVAVPFLENDLIDATHRMAYGYLQKPYLARDAGAWTVVNRPVPIPVIVDEAHMFRAPKSARFVEPDPWLYERSALVRALVRRSSTMPWLAEVFSWLGLMEVVELPATAHGEQFFSVGRIDGRAVDCWLLSACPRERWADGMPAMVAAYVEMARLAERAGVSFAALVTPALAELEQGQVSVSTLFRDELLAAGVPVIDAIDAYRDVDDWRTLTRPAPDYHWTQEGHRRGAEIVAEWAASLGRPAPGD